MKAKIKAKWIAALRSGNFTQGRRALRNVSNDCCCLGVLADICGAKWKLNQHVSPNYECFVQEEDTSSRSIIPDTLRERLGLNQEDQTVLVTMNDGGKTFNQIADWIEENL